MREIGINTWVWASPLTDENLTDLLHHVADLGFDAVELPLETPGDLSPEVVGAVLEATGLTPYVVGAMAPGRDLVATDPRERGSNAAVPGSVHRPGVVHRRRGGVRALLRGHGPRVADDRGRADGGLRRAA